MFKFAYYYEKSSFTQTCTPMENDQISDIKVKDYLLKINSKGRYSFTLDELRRMVPVSERALNQSLFRLKNKKQIGLVRQGFYVIIPPTYSSFGILPFYFYIDQMMNWLSKPYYLGLLTAAALHGSAHQQPMESFVITQPPVLRKIHNDKIAINFLYKKTWADEDIVKKKTETGYVSVSSPELTALDILYYNNWIGIDRATTILAELMDEMKPGALLQTARRFPVIAPIQRLGYLLDHELGNEKLAAALEKALLGRHVSKIALAHSKERKGDYIARWKIIKNMEVESDL